MNINENDLVKIFESYFRFKEGNRNIAPQKLKQCIYAGLSGLQLQEQNEKEIIKQSVDDFLLMSNIMRHIWQTEYDNSINNDNSQEIQKPANNELITLDEAIREYKLPTRVKDRVWRKKHPEFTYQQPSGSHGRIYVKRSDIETFLEHPNNTNNSQ